MRVKKVIPKIIIKLIIIIFAVFILLLWQRDEYLARKYEREDIDINAECALVQSEMIGYVKEHSEDIASFAESCLSGYMEFSYASEHQLELEIINENTLKFQYDTPYFHGLHSYGYIKFYYCRGNEALAPEQLYILNYPYGFPEVIEYWVSDGVICIPQYEIYEVPINRYGCTTPEWQIFLIDLRDMFSEIFGA